MASKGGKGIIDRRLPLVGEQKPKAIRRAASDDVYRNNLHGKTKKKSFTNNLFRRARSMFQRKHVELDFQSKSGKPLKPTRANSTGHKVPRARDSFLDKINKIDFSALALTSGIDDEKDKSLWTTKSLPIPGSVRPDPLFGSKFKYFSTNPQSSLSLRGEIAYMSGVSFYDEDDEENRSSSDDTYQRYRMTKITESLYLGNDEDARDEAALSAEKITHVLSMVARKWSRKRSATFSWKRRKHIKRMCVPMSDMGNSDVTKLLEEKDLQAFMEDSQKRQNKLLVHCQLGQNRSPSIVMAFLMKHEHITFYQAWRKVKQKRAMVQPNLKYIKQLRIWDMYLHGKHSTPEDFLQLKVAGNEISVTHEHANTERMKTIMYDNKRKKKTQVSNLYVSSDSSIVDIDLDIIDSPMEGIKEHRIFNSLEQLGGSEDRESYFPKTNDNFRVSNDDSIHLSPSPENEYSARKSASILV